MLPGFASAPGRGMSRPGASLIGTGAGVKNIGPYEPFRQVLVVQARRDSTGIADYGTVTLNGVAMDLTASVYSTSYSDAHRGKAWVSDIKASSIDVVAPSPYDLLATFVIVGVPKLMTAANNNTYGQLNSQASPASMNLSKPPGSRAITLAMGVTNSGSTPVIAPQDVGAAAGYCAVGIDVEQAAENQAYSFNSGANFGFIFAANWTY